MIFRTVLCNFGPTQRGMDTREAMIGEGPPRQADALKSARKGYAGAGIKPSR